MLATPLTAPLPLSPRLALSGLYDYYDPMRPIFSRAVSQMELLRYESGQTRVKFQDRPAHGDYFVETDGAGRARGMIINFTGRMDIANAEFRKLRLRPFPRLLLAHLQRLLRDGGRTRRRGRTRTRR